MLAWAMIFLLVTLICGALGFGGVHHPAVGIARVLFLVFLVLFAITLLAGPGRRI